MHIKAHTEQFLRALGKLALIFQLVAPNFNFQHCLVLIDVYYSKATNPTRSTGSRNVA